MMQLRKKTYANACLAMMLIAAMPGLVLADQLDELQSRQEKVQAVVKNVLPATVCVTGGVGMGSGVVVSKINRPHLRCSTMVTADWFFLRDNRGGWFGGNLHLRATTACADR